MDLKTHIIASAERAFDQYGFTATGMDKLAEAAQVSSRTLYKHIGSKSELIAAVLAERTRRFFDHADAQNVDALFASLGAWTRAEGARGCLFLRAKGETSEETALVLEAIAGYRERLGALVALAVSNDLGDVQNTMLVDQILVLFEGATSAASYRGVYSISAARAAAAVLIEHAKTP
ncbi:TetR/AcrR family transcriptional regulator [Caballeronia sp. BR00000012568055]|uniref:TetR/AcrR family transcriptional regulator n=1 Tax=Caballeronia sp. BR00000012568055 TaxID=2918761 RepID=UPI0023F68B6B|nr:helix-turn-helix domain-containing protein [Caballeronia sp. BR00000012568055]